MEFIYKPAIVKAIVTATEFLNCTRIFTELKINAKLSEEDFQTYLDYCEKNEYIEKISFMFNNEECYEYIITLGGAQFLFGE